MFQQITKIIMNCITGGGLNSTKDFDVQVFKSGNSYSAKLYPRKKELKQIYKLIELTFNSSLTMVSSVRMEEQTGDETLVNLGNLKTNVSIDEKLFCTN